MDTITNIYEKNLRAVNDQVVLKKLERYGARVVGTIIIPDDADAGFRLTRAEILSLGPVAEQRGLKVGNIVLYDHFSVTTLSHPIVVTKAENIIASINEKST